MAKCVWSKTIPNYLNSFCQTTPTLKSSQSFSTSSAVRGKRNFRCFPLYNFRGSREFKRQQQENPDPEIPVHTYGVRQPGFMVNKKFHLVPEMVPEIIVPEDLESCDLKPYVSYRVEDVFQGEFTAKDLFIAVYSKKIQDDFKNNKLDEHGQSLEPNENEQMTKEQAVQMARKTGCDIFEPLEEKEVC